MVHFIIDPFQIFTIYCSLQSWVGAGVDSCFHLIYCCKWLQSDFNNKKKTISPKNKCYRLFIINTRGHNILVTCKWGRSSTPFIYIWLVLVSPQDLCLPDQLGELLDLWLGGHVHIFITDTDDHTAENGRITLRTERDSNWTLLRQDTLS